MLDITSELKEKLLAAQSAEEAAALVKADGQEITAEDAAHLWEEITKGRENDGKELSFDELEAVSGGADRDWIKDGCAATVEPGSLCGSNDKCYIWDVTYDNPPEATCSNCGYFMVASGKDNGDELYTCVRCGYVLRVHIGTEFDV